MAHVFARSNRVVHKTTNISTFEVVCEHSPLSLFELLPLPKGIMPNEKLTTIENFTKHKRIREHIQPSKEKYCEKLPKTKEKQKWKLHTIAFSPIAHINFFALFQDSHRWKFDPGGQTLTKQEAAIRDQICRSEDRSSQERGDDGHHPATLIPLVEEKALDLRTNPFQEGGDDGRGTNTQKSV